MTKVEKTMQGLRFPEKSTEEENDLAVGLIQALAKDLMEVWEEPKTYEETCVILLAAFKSGTLHLEVDGNDVIVMQGKEVRPRMYGDAV